MGRNICARCAGWPRNRTLCAGRAEPGARPRHPGWVGLGRRRAGDRKPEPDSPPGRSPACLPDCQCGRPPRFFAAGGSAVPLPRRPWNRSGVLVCTAPVCRYGKITRRLTTSICTWDFKKLPAVPPGSAPRQPRLPALQNEQQSLPALPLDWRTAENWLVDIYPPRDYLEPADFHSSFAPGVDLWSGKGHQRRARPPMVNSQKWDPNRRGGLAGCAPVVRLFMAGPIPGIRSGSDYDPAAVCSKTGSPIPTGERQLPGRAGS